MQSQTFSKDELFTDFDEESSTTYTLENDHVEIVINIDFDDNLTLVRFYKKASESRKGVVRCALLLLLERILSDHSEITPQHTLSIMKPTPSDGNLERLIKMYQDMGLILKKDPLELKNTIGIVMDTLKTQCNFTAGKKSYKRKKYKRKSRIL